MHVCQPHGRVHHDRVQLTHTILEYIYCSGFTPTVWSECSVKTIAHAIQGMDCLAASDVGGLGTLVGVIICVLVSVPLAVAVCYAYSRCCRHTTHTTKPGSGVLGWLRRAFTGTPRASALATPAPTIATIARPMRSQVR
jgi:hypothetical protein